MDKNKIIDLNQYRQQIKAKKSPLNHINPSTYMDEEERIKTLNLFMKVIATMYKESYK